MAIPGIPTELPLRAKIRVGEKNDRGYPTALDHFKCDHPDFAPWNGAKTLRIRFPYATVEECFPSGLERWVMKKDRTGNILTCYTKGDGVAHRLTKGDKDANGEYIIDPTKGSERLDMPCRAQQCPLYGKEKSKGCRPKARLNFFIVDDPRVDSVWRFETQSLNTYSGIAAILGQYPDLRGHEFILSAVRVKQGDKHFTVVEIAAVSEPAGAVGDKPEGSQTVRPGAGSPSGAPSPRNVLMEYLRDTARLPLAESQIAWIRDVGPEAALAALQQMDAESGA